MTDSDCSTLDVNFNGAITAKGACLEHMWAYNGQKESAKGCWDLSVCSNSYSTSSYTVFDGRKI